MLYFVCSSVCLSHIFPNAVKGSFFVIQFRVRRAGASRIVSETLVCLGAGTPGTAFVVAPRTTHDQ